MDNPQKLPRVLSLCTGYGGLERGIERVLGKIRVLAHVEIEAFAVANLVDKMETGQMVPAPVWTDLKTLPLAPFRDHVDILTGGYPCQPFSAAGKRLGSEDPRHLWPHILRIIDGVRPGMCFFENVEGHISKGLRRVLSDLESRGYQTAWGIFSAEEVGAPHQRKRVFILADRIGMRKSQLQGGEQEQWEWAEYGSEELADRTNDNRRSGERQAQERIGEDSEWGRRPTSGSKEMGNPQSNHEQRLSITPMHRQGVEAGGSGSRWPARPGEEQYEWEEPRVLADSYLPGNAVYRGGI